MYFNIHRNTISLIQRKFKARGSTAYLPRSSRFRVITPAQNRFFQLRHLRDRLLQSSMTAGIIPDLRRISAGTVRDRFREINLMTRRTAIRRVLTHCHRQQRMAKARQHDVKWTFHQWRRVLFNDESWLGLQGEDGRKWGYRRPCERFSNARVL